MRFILPFCVYFITTVPFEDLIYDLVIYPLKIYPYVRSLPYPHFYLATPHRNFFGDATLPPGIVTPVGIVMNYLAVGASVFPTPLSSGALEISL